MDHTLTKEVDYIREKNHSDVTALCLKETTVPWRDTSTYYTIVSLQYSRFAFKGYRMLKIHTTESF